MGDFKRIHAIGDSHSGTLHDSCHANNCGPKTIYAITQPKDDLLATLEVMIARDQLTRDAMWIFCFGEIDIRCHVHNQIHLKKRLEEDIIVALVDTYLTKIKTLHPDIGVMSVVPPLIFNGREAEVLSDPAFEIYKIVGSDADRSRYTAFMNKYLRHRCEEESLLSVDVYSIYKDENGMLPIECSDGNVHISNRSKIPPLLASMGLIPQPK